MYGFTPAPTRRDVLRSLVGGSLLLPGILSELLAADARCRCRRSARAEDAALSAEGEARHLAVHDRRRVAHGHVRSTSPSCSRPTARRSASAAGCRSNKRPLLKPRWEFKPGGKCGTHGQRPVPAPPRQDGRRLPDPLDDDRQQRALPGHARHPHRLVLLARPSIGSWVSYGLGTVNQNLPSFVVIAPYLPYAGTQVWANDFLPAYHQGTRVVPGPEPMPNVQPRSRARPTCRSWNWAWPTAFNRAHLQRHGNDADLAARIRTFETAFSMQIEAPEAFDLSKETDETLELYGLERGRHDELRLAVPGRPAAGRARRALHRTDRHRLVEQLGLARRHGRPRAAGARRSTSRSPGCSRT